MMAHNGRRTARNVCARGASVAQRLFPRMLVSRQLRRLGTRPVQEQAGTLWQLLRRESSSAESSAANQRLLARTLAANQRLLLGGTLWLPPRRPLFSGNPFIRQELGLSPIRHLRSEVVGRLPY